MTWAALAALWAVHMVAVISPGPAFVVSLRTAASQGFRSGAGVALGLALGVTLWSVAAMGGLALLFAVVPWAFAALKVVGAGFLLLIALLMWRHADDPLPNVARPGESPPGLAAEAPKVGVRRAVLTGFLTNATNPKTILFFGAIFLGFLPADLSLWQRASVLAMLFANELLWGLIVARLFSLAGPRAAYARAKRWIDRLFGTVIAVFAARIALT